MDYSNLPLTELVEKITIRKQPGYNSKFNVKTFFHLHAQFVFDTNENCKRLHRIKYHKRSHILTILNDKMSILISTGAVNVTIVFESKEHMIALFNKMNCYKKVALTKVNKLEQYVVDKESAVSFVDCL
jgi:hypothetical protein